MKHLGWKGLQRTHLIFKWLQEAGYNIKQAQTLLRCNYSLVRLQKINDNPLKYLTLQRIVILSEATGRSVVDVLTAFLPEHKIDIDREFGATGIEIE